MYKSISERPEEISVNVAQELKRRRERIATALMANLMRGDMTDCDMRDYVKLSIQGTDALIKALDEVKE